MKIKMKQMVEKITSMNKVLVELIIGIAACGVFFEAAGVCLVADKMRYSMGLFMGILIAIIMAFHMEWALNTALDLTGQEAEKKIRKHSILRYLAVVIALAVIMQTGIANPLAAFLGIMSLKVAAYLQPITHRVMQKIKKNEEERPS